MNTSADTLKQQLVEALSDGDALRTSERADRIFSFSRYELAMVLCLTTYNCTK